MTYLNEGLTILSSVESGAEKVNGIHKLVQAYLTESCVICLNPIILEMVDEFRQVAKDGIATDKEDHASRYFLLTFKAL